MESLRSCRTSIVCLAVAAGISVSAAAEAAVCSVTDRIDDASVPGTLRWCVGRVNSGLADQIEIVQSGTYYLEAALQIDRDVDIAPAAGSGALIQPGDLFQDDTLIRIGCGALACVPVVSIGRVQIWSGGVPGWRGIDVRRGSVLTLDRVLMADFDIALDGGALRAQGETLVHLIDSQFDKNRGARGGAVFSSGILLEAIDCRFQGNRATSEGGAIHFRMSPFFVVGQLHVETSDFLDNATPFSGGAIYVTGLTSVVGASVTGSLFAFNQAGVRGGALDGFADVSLSTFSGNRAPIGGALSLGANSLVADSLFGENRALQGGAIAFRTTSPQTGLTVRGSTLAKNDYERQNDTFGAGIYLSGGTHLIENTTLSANGLPGTVMAFNTTGGALAVVGGATAELRHATLEANGGDTGAGVYVDATSRIAFSSSIVANSRFGFDCSVLGSTSQTTSLSTQPACLFSYLANPQLGPLNFNGGPTPTHLPASGSLAIDRATCFSSVDQRGKVRPAIPDTLCDIGSVEAR